MKKRPFPRLRFVKGERIHVKNTKNKRLRCRSLCIIDEFGKGTLTTDGVGLLAAALRRLATAAEPPKVVAATHFSALLNADYLPRLAANSARCTQYGV